MPDVPVEVMLWDCDGVLQHGRFDWRERLDEAVGPGFARKVFEAELPALRGERSLRAVLGDLLEQENRFGQLPVTIEALLGIWEQFDLDPEAIALVDEVSRLGVRCLLASNQQDHRVRFMREVHGYDDIAEGAYWSSEVGAMKPDPAFFEHILDDLGVPADRVGFVDDVPANVESAHALGIRAVHHEPPSGAAGLRRALHPLVPALAQAPHRPDPRA